MAKSRKNKRRNRPAGNGQPRHNLLDVVIPVHGRLDLTKRCLEALSATRDSLPLNVIIVDDYSPNRAEMLEYYATLPRETVILKNAKNLGFPATANRGALQGSSEFILFLSTDIVLHPGCVRYMLDEFNDPKVGVVGPKLLFPDDSDDPTRLAGKVQHAGLCVDINGEIVHANIGWSADHPKVNERRVLQAVTGGCLMTRRAAWNKVTSFYKTIGDPTKGGFNLVYGRGTYEDVEYCIAARGNDFQVVYQPKAVAVHHVGGSIKATGEGFALKRNSMIFRARCGHMLAWDMWRFC
jgi:GT2 family glycosyltransferase